MLWWFVVVVSRAKSILELWHTSYVVQKYSGTAAYLQPPASSWPLCEAPWRLNNHSRQSILLPSVWLNVKINWVKPTHLFKILQSRPSRAIVAVFFPFRHSSNICQPPATRLQRSQITKTTNMSVQCYRHSWGKILNQTGKDYPCGNLNSTDSVVPCCASGDVCLTNGICSYQKSLVGGSGYYVAGCTASSGLCPGFPNRCTSQFLPDVTWNSTSGLWQCCGVDSNNNPACNDPTNEQFIAPSPAALQTIFSISRDGWTATSTTLLSMSTPFPDATSTTPVSAVKPSATTAVSEATTTPPVSPNGISSGTKAGVGIGASLVLLTVFGLVAYLVFHKRKRRLCAQQRVDSLAERDSITALHELQSQSRAVHELGSKDAQAIKIGTRSIVHELEARH